MNHRLISLGLGVLFWAVVIVATVASQDASAVNYSGELLEALCDEGEPCERWSPLSMASEWKGFWLLLLGFYLWRKRLGFLYEWAKDKYMKWGELEYGRGSLAPYSSDPDRDPEFTEEEREVILEKIIVRYGRSLLLVGILIGWFADNTFYTIYHLIF